MEEVEFVLKHTVETMEKSVARLSKELSKIRAGKAMPNMLDALNVDYYGNSTPINQVASITTPDARTLIIKPWEKSIIGEIEKVIINSDLGLNPQKMVKSLLLIFQRSLRKEESPWLSKRRLRLKMGKFLFATSEKKPTNN